MGCDIHMVVQTRSITGKWTTEDVHVLDDRNYVLFAILAGVRNGYGFAGVNTHEPLTPIDVTRDLPSDFETDDEGQDVRTGTWMGDHSHSHLTLDEILAYDFSRKLIRTGVVGPADYLSFREKGKPDGWSADIFGGSIVKISNEEMDHRIEQNSWEVSEKNLKAMHLENGRWSWWEKQHAELKSGNIKPVFVTRIEWSEPLSDIVRDFLNWTVELLQRFGDERDIRLVFGFDS